MIKSWTSAEDRRDIGLAVLSMNVLYARYHITPARELQFGAMMLNSRKTRSFTIENLGNKFEFRFNISATPADMVVVPVTPVPPAKDEKKKWVVCISICFCTTVRYFRGMVVFQCGVVV